MNEKTESLDCLLLGEEPLLQSCGDELLTRGHRIGAVVTNSPGLQAWAEDHDLPVLKRAQLRDWVIQHPPDVLLSITYPALIPVAVITSVKIAALNYHDGPLPRYAGINGSAWALHNGEREHSIVWHHLTAELDAGDILERRDVTLDAAETSLSLNIKNATLALEAFSCLVTRIEERRLDGAAQDTSIERTIFSRHDRPAELCVIDWTKEAATIDSLVRSCDFGRFTNRFGAAKIVHREACLVVQQCFVLDDETKRGSPGTVSETSEKGIIVACGGGRVQLTRFSTTAGAAVSVEDAAKILGVVVGQTLQNHASASRAQASRRVAEREPYFVRRLLNRRLPTLPFKPCKGASVTAPVALTADFVRVFEGKLDAAMGAALSLVLSSLLREDSFTVALTSSALQASPMGDVIFGSLPLTVQLDRHRSFRETVDQLVNEIGGLNDDAGFLKDLVGRHPGLRDQADLGRGMVSPVAFALGPMRVLPGAKLSLVLSQGAGALVTDGSISLEDAQRLAAWVGNVINTVGQHPDRPLGSIDMLAEEERKRCITEWNSTARAYPNTARIFDLFEQRVVLQPDAIALVFGDEHMSFLELEHAANRIAHAVRARGVVPGQFVGLQVERGFDLVIALLGIAKSGAAYVPIDVIYPAERAEFMLRDAGVRLVLASPSFVDRCGDRDVLIVGGAEVMEAPVDRFESGVRSDQVCYTIFTSGSTGQPKGVVLTHQAVVNTLDWVNRTFEVTPEDRLLFVTSPSFDLSVYDVFGALGAGASIEIAPEDLTADPEAMVQRLCNSAITIWDSAPPALARLAPFFPARAPASKLRLVMMSGDWIPVGLPDHLMQVFPRVSVKSLGGATEAAIWSNFFHVDEVDPSWKSIPYGRPIQNARYYILDHHQRPLPANVTGELYIGGTCLAQGYLERPELTSERFLADPFVSGERIYRTGDLSQFWGDGTMEFLGRSDSQVKIRGFRVEIGEIEVAICALPGIRTALCTADVDASGHKALAAYVIRKKSTALDATALKQALSKHMPDFMVPTYVIFLDAFPLSSNGKVDRKRLPKPEGIAAEVRDIVEPRTPIEETLVTVFKEVLKLDSASIHDNFFDLGGSSLQILQVIDRLHKRGVSLDPAEMFRNPTVSKLAGVVGARVADTGEDSGTIVVMQQHGANPPLFLVHSMPGDLLGYGDLVQDLGIDQPVYGIHGLGPIRADQSIVEMAQKYASRLAAFKPTGTIHLGGWCFGATVALEMATILRDAGRQVGLVVLIEAAPSRSSIARKLHRVRELVRVRGARGERIKRMFKSLVVHEEFDEGTFALEITAGPFANRASNYRNNRAAAAKHRTTPYAGEITLIQAVPEDGEVASDEGWGQFADGVQLRSISTSHTDIICRPHSEEVARHIIADISRAEENIQSS